MTSFVPPSATFVCPTELAIAARIGGWCFRHRGWLPLPFLIAPLLYHGEITLLAWLNGFTAISAGVALRLWAVAAAGSETRRRSRTVHRLVTYGPFAWTRNPLYVANAIIWVGFSIIAGVHWFVLVNLTMFAFVYSAIVRYEEGVLESIFGKHYLDYKARTPRWFPAPPSAPPSGPESAPLEWAVARRSERSTLVTYAVIAVLLLAKSLWS